VRRRSLRLERAEDRAGTAELAGAGAGEAGQRVARLPQLVDLRVERRDSGPRQLPCPDSVVV